MPFLIAYSFFHRRLWDASSGRCLRTLVDNDNPPVSSVVFSPNGKYILAGSLDNIVRIWSQQTGRCVKSFVGHKNTKYCCFPSFLGPDMIASGSEDGKLFVWDMNSKQILIEDQVFEGPLLALAVSPDASMLAVASVEPENSIKIMHFNK